MSDDENSPRTAESVPVTLARIEGKLDLVAYRTGVIEETVAAHAKDIGDLRMFTQRLSDEADSDRATAKALAEALEKDAATRRQNSEQKWSPFQRVITVLLALVAIAGFVVALIK